MKTVYVAIRELPIGTRLTAAVVDECFRKDRREVDGGGFCNPSKHVDKYLHAALAVGEPLHRSVVRLARPLVPRFAVGQIVTVMRNVRIPFDGGFTVARGAKWKVEAVEPHPELKSPPRYKLSIGIGGKEPIGHCWKSERVIR